MNKKICLLVVLFSCFTSVLAGAAKNNLEINKSFFPVRINGVVQEKKNDQYIINDMLYVPCREFCEKLGIDIEWNEKEWEVGISTLDKKIMVNNQEEYKEEGVIPDKETAYIVGKTILEKYAGRSLEYEKDDKIYYLYTTLVDEDIWYIEQFFKYTDGRTVIATGRGPVACIMLSKNTGEVIGISTRSWFEENQ